MASLASHIRTILEISENWKVVAMWVHDLRVGVRSAVKAPGFSSTVVAVLAIAIAAATATFSVAYHVLLAPLPITAEERVVLLQKKLQLANTLVPFAASDLIALRERCRTCDSASGVQYDGAFPAAVQDGDATLSVRATLVVAAVVGALATTIPALRAARTNITDTLRND